MKFAITIETDGDENWYVGYVVADSVEHASAKLGVKVMESNRGGHWFETGLISCGLIPFDRETSKVPEMNLNELRRYLLKYKEDYQRVEEAYQKSLFE